MKILGIIPARYGSSRFPGKPLIDIAGKTMIERVYRQVQQSTLLDQIIVATDDHRILNHVLGFGGNATLTKDTHESGTDRCAEVSSSLSEFDVAINIQGDEPFIDATQIDLLASCFADENTEIATLIRLIDSSDDLFNENKPKVVVNEKLEALYFSRQAIPFLRGVNKENWIDQHTFYGHIGLYGYRTDVLHNISTLPVSTLEKMEALEQLRWLEAGYSIKTAISDHRNDAIDTPEDLQAVLKKYF